MSWMSEAKSFGRNDTPRGMRMTSCSTASYQGRPARSNDPEADAVRSARPAGLNFARPLGRAAGCVEALAAAGGRCGGGVT